MKLISLILILGLLFSGCNKTEDITNIIKKDENFDKQCYNIITPILDNRIFISNDDMIIVAVSYADCKLKHQINTIKKDIKEINERYKGNK